LKAFANRWRSACCASILNRELANLGVKLFNLAISIGLLFLALPREEPAILSRAWRFHVRIILG